MWGKWVFQTSASEWREAAPGGGEVKLLADTLRQIQENNRHTATGMCIVSARDFNALCSMAHKLLEVETFVRKHPGRYIDSFVLTDIFDFKEPSE